MLYCVSSVPPIDILFDPSTLPIAYRIAPERASQAMTASLYSELITDL